MYCHHLSISFAQPALIFWTDGVFSPHLHIYKTSLVAQTVKRLLTMWETCVRSLGQEDPLGKEIETHSSTLLNRWAGKASVYNAGDPGSIPGSGRSPGEGNGNPLQYYCLKNPRDRGAWWATVPGVTKSWTRLSDFTFLSFPYIYNISTFYIFFIVFKSVFYFILLTCGHSPKIA